MTADEGRAVGTARQGRQVPRARQAAVPPTGSCHTDEARGTRGQGGAGHSSVHDSPKLGPPRCPSGLECPLCSRRGPSLGAEDLGRKEAGAAGQSPVAWRETRPLRSVTPTPGQHS